MLLAPDPQPAQPAAPPGILRKFAYLLSARWVRDALQTVFLIYLARLSSTTYGEFMLALGLGSILTFVTDFGLNLPLVSLLSRKESDPGAALSQVSLLKVIILGLALAGVLGFVHWQGYSPPLQRLMLLLGAGLAAEALANTFFVTLQVKGRQDLQGKVKSLAAAAGFGYGLLALVLGAPPLAVALYKLIESAINLGGAAYLGLTLTRSRLKWPPLRQLTSVFRLGLIFGAIEVTGIIYNKANLFFLQRYAGTEGVAQYSVSWQTVDGISVLVSNLLLQSILYPLFVRLWETDRAQVPRLAQNTARWLMALALLVMFVLFIESDRLIPLIYGPKYPEAVWLQRYLVPAVAFAFFYNLAAFLLYSMRLAPLLLVFCLLGLGLNLLWCTLVIPRAPLVGGALAMVVTKGAVAIMTVLYCHRRLQLIPWQALKQLGVAVAVGGCLYFLGDYFWRRELAEVLAVTPLLTLIWRWWREDRK
jgi:O-antigen/teichoic acid export membrane protein